ncbi:MAG: trypsin-like peptidase domain-containing protein [Thermoguttaceae bacterium]|jgi:S1-C subfamily serine protease
MRKLVFLCLLSGIAGTAAAVVWFGGPAVEPQSVAQEPAPSGYVPPGGPAGSAATTPSAADQPTAADLQNLTPDERVNVLVYQNVNRCVVNINVTGERSFWGVTPEGEGSGSVIDRQGHILTNFHVIDLEPAPKQILVTLFDGSEYPAQVVGYDPATDVAVLKINAPPELLFPVAFGSSTNLLVGQRVFAIGNPFGFERTLTTGIISSLNRSLPAKRTARIIKSVIQIDAAMNPGNSGGPLLDTHGLMIGMNTAIATSTGGSEGVGFAIPINTIARVVPQLIQNHRVLRPESGIDQVRLNDRGLLIEHLVSGGPAEKAGLKATRIERKQEGIFVVLSRNLAAADIITAVDGKQIKTPNDFLDAIESKRPGEQVMLTIIRAGKLIQVPLPLEAAK